MSPTSAQLGITEDATVEQPFIAQLKARPGYDLGYPIRVESAHVRCVHCRAMTPTRTDKGAPDIIIARPGFLGLDMKTGGATFNANLDPPFGARPDRAIPFEHERLLAGE